MSIRFIRKFPDGSDGRTTIDRPHTIETMAATFRARGGRYVIYKHSDDKVELSAVRVIKVDGEAVDMVTIATEFTPDGIELPLAVDRLVRASMAKESVQ